jgi:hypothetical protein
MTETPTSIVYRMAAIPSVEPVSVSDSLLIMLSDL